MALGYIDFKRPRAPHGVFSETMFSGVDFGTGFTFDDALTNWLEYAVTVTTDEDAQADYVKWQGYEVLFNEFSNSPASQSHDGLSISYTPQQVASFERKALHHKQRYEAQISTTVAVGPILSTWQDS